MVKGHENKQISGELKVPLSTIQRRTKNITDSGVVRTKTVPDFKKLGIKQGLLHIYLRDGNIRRSASQIAKMDGILSASIQDRKSTRLNSSHSSISYAVFCLK